MCRRTHGLSKTIISPVDRVGQATACVVCHAASNHDGLHGATDDKKRSSVPPAHAYIPGAAAAISLFTAENFSKFLLNLPAKSSAARSYAPVPPHPPRIQ